MGKVLVEADACLFTPENADYAQNYTVFFEDSPAVPHCEHSIDAEGKICALARMLTVTNCRRHCALQHDVQPGRAVWMGMGICAQRKHHFWQFSQAFRQYQQGNIIIK